MLARDMLMLMTCTLMTPGYDLTSIKKASYVQVKTITGANVSYIMKGATKLFTYTYHIEGAQRIMQINVKKGAVDVGRLRNNLENRSFIKENNIIINITEFD